jgi:hypothetical protein
MIDNRTVLYQGNGFFSLLTTLSGNGYFYWTQVPEPGEQDEQVINTIRKVENSKRLIGNEI